MLKIKVIHNGVEKEMTARKRLGDRVERVLSMIPGVMSLPCHDQTTGQLKPESGCGKRKAWLNALSTPSVPSPTDSSNASP